MSELEKLKERLSILSEENGKLLVKLAENKKAKDQLMIEVFLKENSVKTGEQIHFKAHDTMIPVSLHNVWVKNGVVYFEVVPEPSSMPMFGSLFRREFRGDSFAKMFQA
jgi:hypothetical protein